MKFIVHFFLLIGPWNHVLCVIVGGYIGYNWEKWETELIVAVNEKRYLPYLQVYKHIK